MGESWIKVQAFWSPCGVTMMQSGKCKIDSVVVVVDSAVAPGTGERVLVLLITRLRLHQQGGFLP